MTLTSHYDPDADAAYIYVRYPIGSGEVKETMPVDMPEGSPIGCGVNLDFDGEGKLVGIEIFGARELLGDLVLNGLNLSDK